jgi:penicillin-binding protein 2B
MGTKQRIKWRSLLMGLSFILTFGGLITRLWWLQAVDARENLERAKDQWELQKILQPKRGSILDRNGQVLAYEEKAYNLSLQIKPADSKEEEVPEWMRDNYVKDPYMTAQKLAPILGVQPDLLLQKMAAVKKPGSIELGMVGKKLTEDQKKQIDALMYPVEGGKKEKTNQLPGVVLQPTTRRYYPKNSFAAHVLGYISYGEGRDEAHMGIEKQYDKELSGEPGELQVLTDGAGYQLPDGEQKFKPAKDGQNVVLTIDQQIQDYVEAALDETQQKFTPKSMTVIVADPNNGDILAMASRPGFNPNEYWSITDYRNQAISSVFEPGSTFKIITLAAAIQEGKFNPGESYKSGTYTKLPGEPIRDHNWGNGWGNISFLEGVQRSSNVAFVILGYERLKADLLAKYFDLFGIGKKTGIDLPKEAEGIMFDLKHPRSQRDVAVTTFGQGVAVTAIQQVAAVGAIANGGELLKPHIVKELRDPHTGEVTKKYDKEVVRRVVSEATAKQTRDILETVVTGEHGTGQAFNIDGYHVAGKTGTAQIYDAKTGKIVPGRYVVSFIGFAPKDDPRLLVYVVVNDPETDLPSTTWGSEIVAPIFKSVMEKSLKYLKEVPDLGTVEAASLKKTTKASALIERAVPKLTEMSANAAVTRAKQAGFQSELIGSGTKVVQQYPAADETAPQNSTILLLTDKVEGVKMPDFTGKSLREVMEYASMLKLDVSPTGSGFVKEQSIAPGTVIKEGETLRVTLAAASSP